jgi:23S rRNA (uracil1939-C5)-methyltransferase
VDAVLLDPPRTGALEALAGIVLRRPETIVYVSCNTATLARDLGELAKAGYDAEAATAFDMFPHTPHLEAVVRLRSRPRAQSQPAGRSD